VVSRAPAGPQPDHNAAKVLECGVGDRSGARGRKRIGKNTVARGRSDLGPAAFTGAEDRAAKHPGRHPQSHYKFSKIFADYTG
jgi:hypothetical protein